MANLTEIEGISSEQAEKLKGRGLQTTDDLLKAGATPKGRAEMAAVTAISQNLILRWVNMADLYRIRGVGEQYSDLLEASGVDTVPELAKRSPTNLLTKMTQVNEQKQLVHRVPTEEQVAAWIAEARTLPRMITYGGSHDGAAAYAGDGHAEAEAAPAPAAEAEQAPAASAPDTSVASAAGQEEAWSAPGSRAGQPPKDEVPAGEGWWRRLWRLWQR
jgi:predicted flap endonuclease-1-like 5' DNA nuclease